MKLTTQLEAEVIEAYKNFWVANLSANMENFGSYLVDDFSIIGSAKGETFFSREDTIAFYSATADELKDKAELRNRLISVQGIDEQTVVVRELCDLYVLLDKDWAFYGHARISCVMKKINNGWKTFHQHASFPDHRTEEGQQLASEKIEKENLELKEAVQRRTVELEYKNRELEIEAALERIRAVAMGMSHTNDLVEIAKVQFTELQQLGFEDVRNSLIGVFHEGKDYFTDYDYSDICGGNITDIPINGNVIIERAIKRMKSATDVFTEFVVEGQDMSEWKAFRLSNGEYDDPRIADAEVLYYYFYSVNNGIVGISTFKKITSAQLDILKKFRNVFDLAYKRYLDISKAEAQASESRLEMALEKVRSRTMAMQHSDELADASFVLDTQVRSLGIETWGCAFNIYGDNESTEWFSSATGTLPPYKTPREDFFLRAYEAGKSGQQIYVEEFAGEACEAHYEYLQTIPVMGDAVRSMIEKGGSFPEKQTDHAIFFKYGYLLFITPGAVPGAHEIFIRFAKVFEQTYTRFLDLQKAEEQTREAQIEASLDRVRARAMAMHESDDLQNAVAVVFEELEKLNLGVLRVGISVLNKENRNGNVWLTSVDKGKAVQVYGDEDFDFHPLMKGSMDAWINQHDFYYVLEGDDLTRYYQAVEAAKFGLPQSQLLSSGNEYKRQSCYVAVYNAGGLFAFMEGDFPEEAKKVMRRFAMVFDLTYKRFLDLQKAEAQTFRAQQDLIEIKAARKKAEETLSQLRATQTQLIQAEKMASLGELTAGIAHEIQNPLNFVNNFSDLSNELIDEMLEEMAKGNFGEARSMLDDIKQNLNKINHHGKRADAIVKGMLQHSQSAKGKKEPTDINALCDEYLRLSYHGLRAKDKAFNANLTTEFDDSIGKINLVAQDIGRVIMNLLTNAFYAVSDKLKGSQPGLVEGGFNYKPAVSIITKKSNDAVEIIITDNGQGIPTNIIDKIFQPFFTTKPTGQGTGLGLSLSYDIIKAHGGELKVETELNKGSTFIILLPATEK